MVLYDVAYKVPVKTNNRKENYHNEEDGEYLGSFSQNIYEENLSLHLLFIYSAQ